MIFAVDLKEYFYLLMHMYIK